MINKLNANNVDNGNSSESCLRWVAKKDRRSQGERPKGRICYLIKK